MTVATLYCRESPSLKLGPNSEIVFSSGFATVPVLDETRLEWIRTAGVYIEVLEEIDEPPRATCAVCSRPLKPETRQGRPVIRPIVTPTGQWFPPEVLCRCHAAPAKGGTP